VGTALIIADEEKFYYFHVHYSAASFARVDQAPTRVGAAVRD
jgi:hypothetical protein